MRNVTILFFKLPRDWTDDPTEDTQQVVDSLQKSFTDIEREINKYDGMIAHLSSDDKGISFCCVGCCLPLGCCLLFASWLLSLLLVVAVVFCLL